MKNITQIHGHTRRWQRLSAALNLGVLGTMALAGASCGSPEGAIFDEDSKSTALAVIAGRILPEGGSSALTHTPSPAPGDNPRVAIAWLGRPTEEDQNYHTQSVEAVDGGSGLLEYSIEISEVPSVSNPEAMWHEGEVSFTLGFVVAYDDQDGDGELTLPSFRAGTGDNLLGISAPEIIVYVEAESCASTPNDCPALDQFVSQTLFQELQLGFTRMSMNLDFLAQQQTCFERVMELLVNPESEETCTDCTPEDAYSECLGAVTGNDIRRASGNPRDLQVDITLGDDTAAAQVCKGEWNRFCEVAEEGGEQVPYCPGSGQMQVIGEFCFCQYRAVPMFGSCFTDFDCLNDNCEAGACLPTESQVAAGVELGTEGVNFLCTEEEGQSVLWTAVSVGDADPNLCIDTSQNQVVRIEFEPEFEDWWPCTQSTP